MEEAKARGWERRAKLTWAKGGDVPGKFFFSRLKAKRTGASLPCFPDTPRVGLIDHSCLKEHVRSHFSQLYEGVPLLGNWEAVWEAKYHRFPKKLSAQQQALLDLPITEEEVLDGLRSMPAGKSPGKDGIPPEFFRWGWEFMKSLLVGAIHDVWEAGTMGEELNESLIALVPKKEAHRSVDNWRPISLLSTFYKVIAKVLANRIAPFMDQWMFGASFVGDAFSTT